MILFYIKEVIKSIFRAKLSFVLALITTFIAILLITASILLLTVSSTIEENIKDKITINVFLKDSLDEEQVYQLIEDLRSEKFVKSVQYLSKEDAQSEFIKETGEDFREILDYNPLPASMEIRLTSQYTQPDSINKVSETLTTLNGVDDVVYQKKFIYQVLETVSSVKLYIFAAAIILVLISFYIVFSTNKLIINSKMIQIETMKLVGAKLSSIKIPIILNGLTIGILASAIALIIFIFIEKWLGVRINTHSYPYFQNLFVYLIISVIGPVLGLLASFFASRNITLKIKKFAL